MHLQDTPDERWLPLPDWEERYWVSSLGRVWSIRRQRPLQPTHNPVVGRLFIKLWTGTAYKSFVLHDLVARTFLGTRPPAHEIDHIDNDRMNNRANNLEYVTPTENKRRFFVHNGHRHPDAKLTPDQVRFIRSLPSRRHLARELGIRFGVSIWTIYAVRSRRIWPEVG